MTLEWTMHMVKLSISFKTYIEKKRNKTDWNWNFKKYICLLRLNLQYAFYIPYNVCFYWHSKFYVVIQQSFIAIAVVKGNLC